MKLVSTSHLDQLSEQTTPPAGHLHIHSGDSNLSGWCLLSNHMWKGVLPSCELATLMAHQVKTPTTLQVIYYTITLYFFVPNKEIYSI